MNPSTDPRWIPPADRKPGECHCERPAVAHVYGCGWADWIPPDPDDWRDHAALMDEALAAVEAVTVERIAAWHEQRGIESREIAWIAASRDLGHVAGIAYVDAETHDNAAARLRAGEWQSSTESPTGSHPESPTENEDA